MYANGVYFTSKWGFGFCSPVWLGAGSTKTHMGKPVPEISRLVLQALEIQSWEKPQKLNYQIFWGSPLCKKKDQTQHATLSCSLKVHSSKSCLKFNRCTNSWVIKMERLPFGFKGNWIWSYMLLHLNTMGWVKHGLSDPGLKSHKPYLKHSTLCVNNVFVTAILWNA